MGTRHLIAAFFAGEYRIAQYGQWDGYPSGQGVHVLRFARDLAQDEVIMARFKNNLMASSWISSESLNKLWRNAGANENGFISYDAAKKFEQQHPELSRDTSAEILDLVLYKPLVLQNSIDFAQDSLFCEWAYVLDLDKGTLEAFEGFNQEPLDPSERFSLPKTQTASGEAYAPVRLKKEWKLSELPTEEEFLAAFEPSEEETESAA